MAKKQLPKRRKKVRLTARFYTIVSTFFIMVLITLFFWRNPNTQIPNLHGWESAAVLEFAREHDINVEFAFSYSETIAPTLVISQSVVPRTRIETGMRLVVEVSKGIEVR